MKHLWKRIHQYVHTKELSVEAWGRELKNLSYLCAQEGADFEEQAARKAYYLAVLSPPPIRRFLNIQLSERELEIWLSLNDAEHVARSIAGYHAPVQQIGSITSPRYRVEMQNGEDQAFIAEGATPMLAILGAWAKSLL